MKPLRKQRRSGARKAFNNLEMRLIREDLRGTHLRRFNAVFNYQIFDSGRAAHVILRNALIPDMSSVLSFFHEHLAKGICFWTVDCRLILKMSSSGLAGLVKMHKEAVKAGGELTLIFDPGSEIGKFLKFVQLDHLVPVAEMSMNDSALTESVNRWPIYSMADDDPSTH